MSEALLIAGKTEYSLDKEFLVIGRDLNCNIDFQDTLLSRMHMVIVPCNGRFLVVDLMSSNGVMVNSNRIDFAHLKHGDLLEIGEQSFVFRYKESLCPNWLPLPMASLSFDSQTIELGCNTLVIGRDLNCDLVIEEEEVSRKHAIIAPADGHHLLIDLKSVNGVKVNSDKD